MPTANRGADTPGQVMLTRPDVLHPLLQQKVHRDPQAAQQLGRRGIGEIAGVIEPDHVRELEIGAAHPCRPRHLKCLRGHAEETQTRRQHEALLRTGDRQIDTPVLHLERDRGDRGNTVHEEKRGVAQRVQNLANRLNVRGHAGRGFVLRDANGLDLVTAVGPEDTGILSHRNALAPFDIQNLGPQAQPFSHLDPKGRKLAEPRHQDPVALVQRVGECGLPGAGPGRREHEDPAGAGAENLLQIIQKRLHEPAEVGRTHVLHRQVHGLPDGFRHICGAGDEKMGVSVHGAVLLR